MKENLLVVNIYHKVSYDVYIGRGKDPSTGQLSNWGNPYTHNPKLKNLIIVDSRKQAVEAYRQYLYQQIKENKVSLEELAGLYGKTLACWCSPKLCHGDVLVKASKWAYGLLNN